MGSRKQNFAVMNSLIKKLYIDKDYDLFYYLCLKDDFKLPTEIVDFSKAQQIEIKKIKSNNAITSISEWNLFFPNYQSGECITKYRTYFCFSKLCNMFYINHYFEIKDLNPDSLIIDSMLEGEGAYGDPIICTQADLTDIIQNEMKNSGIEQLNANDATLIYPGIKYNIGNSYDIPEESLQLSYWDLLFSDDILEFLPWRP